MVKPLSSILIKPTGADCNIDCTYCFYLEKASLYPERPVHRMSGEVLEAMVRQGMEYGGGGITFSWQGGEPTLMGLPFFEKAVAFQQRYGRPGQRVANSMQTNGLLLDEQWAEFFRKYRFLIGLSLDGPEHVHDHYRVTKNGRPTWAKVVEKARMLLTTGVQANVLVVVSDYSARYAREIYRFLSELGFTFMQFIPCVETDPGDRTRAAPYSVSAEAYGRFLCEVFDCWQADWRDGRPRTSVRWIDSVFHTYVGRIPPECTLLRECGCYVVVEHNGDVYACDFFVEGDWKLGNLLSGSLFDMLNSERQAEFGRLKAQLPPECPPCPWLSHCYGGCTKDRLRDPADGGSNHFCGSYKMFFEHAHETLSRLAEDFVRQQNWRRALAAGVDPAQLGRNDPCPCGSGKKYKACCKN
ncbi:anaerobic sulfatase maturase [bacterium]|nr:anaerobic sulfatase maturase [bacterium]